MLSPELLARSVVVLFSPPVLERCLPLERASPARFDALLSIHSSGAGRPHHQQQQQRQANVQRNTRTHTQYQHAEQHPRPRTHAHQPSTNTRAPARTHKIPSHTGGQENQQQARHPAQRPLVSTSTSLTVTTTTTTTTTATTTRTEQAATMTAAAATTATPTITPPCTSQLLLPWSCILPCGWWRDSTGR
jgi:hypothetical protein